jgi:type I restriction enzyme R subunit
MAENPKTLRDKVEVIVEHLAGKVLDQIGHRARAMLVTSSRQQAVSYKREVGKYLADCPVLERSAIRSLHGTEGTD